MSVNLLDIRTNRRKPRLNRSPPLIYSRRFRAGILCARFSRRRNGPYVCVASLCNLISLYSTIKRIVVDLRYRKRATLKASGISRWNCLGSSSVLRSFTKQIENYKTTEPVKCSMFVVESHYSIRSIWSIDENSIEIYSSTKSIHLRYIAVIIISFMYGVFQLLKVSFP